VSVKARVAALDARPDSRHHGDMADSRAKVRWLSFEEGGRQKPPTGPRYSSTARFAADPSAGEPWSLVLYIGSDPADVLVSPLVDAVPTQLLARGSRFDLFEGEVKVGEGEIV
jgi:hypothetical protein